MFKTVTAVLVLLSASHAFAFRGQMRDASVVQCGVKSCARVSAPTADVGFISSNLNLQKAKLSLLDRATGKSQEFNASEIYFDHRAQRIYLHGVTELKNAEAFYDMQSEELKVFSN